MALRLLLDEHIASGVASALQRRGFDVIALRQWHGGRYLKEPDDELLRAAHEAGRALVTYDVNTTPLVLRDFSASATEHSGVIFVSVKTIRPDDVGGLVRALEQLLADTAAGDLRDQQLFLTR